jgi:hypothetical protein
VIRSGFLGLICREFSSLCPDATPALKRSSLLSDIARSVRTWILPTLAVSLLLTALASFPSSGASLESTYGCHRYTSTGDVAARELARTAQTGAETLATRTQRHLQGRLPHNPAQAGTIHVRSVSRRYVKGVS